MSWNSMSVMDEKMRFVMDCPAGEETMTMLCERYGISRRTGYLGISSIRLRTSTPRTYVGISGGGQLMNAKMAATCLAAQMWAQLRVAQASFLAPAVRQMQSCPD